MATLRELMSQVKRIEIAPTGPLVEQTVATEIRNGQSRPRQKSCTCPAWPRPQALSAWPWQTAR